MKRFYLALLLIVLSAFSLWAASMPIGGATAIPAGLPSNNTFTGTNTFTKGIAISGSGKGVTFPDGSFQPSAAIGGGAYFWNYTTGSYSPTVTAYKTFVGPTDPTTLGYSEFNAWVCTGPSCPTSPWIDDNSYISLATAAAAAATKGVALHISKVWTITANTDLSAAPEVDVLAGGGFTSSNGSTVTLPTNFRAGDAQCFFGNVAAAGLNKARPQQFGAVGDGTTDDYAAVLAAASSLKAKGGTLELTTTFATGTMLTIDNSWNHAVRINGTGPKLSGLKFLSSAAGSSCIFFHNAPDGCSVTNMSLVGSWGFTPPLYTEVVNNNGILQRTEGSNTQSMVFDNLDISYFGYDAIQLISVSGAKVSNCILHHCAYEGVLVSLYSTNCIIEKNLFYLLKWGMDSNGNDISITNNTFNRMLDVYETHGITSERNDASWDVGRLSITNNIFNNVGDNAINISANSPAYPISDVLISGNIIKVNAQSGLAAGENNIRWGNGLMIGNATNVNITGNSIGNCLSSLGYDQTGICIKLATVAHSQITGNTIDGATVAAVKIGSDGASSVVENDLTINNNVFANSSIGVQFSDTVNGSNLAFNIFKGMTTAAFGLNLVAPTSTTFFMNSTFGCVADVQGTNWPTGAPVWHIGATGNLSAGFLLSDTSAGLDLSSMGKAFSPPRMTTLQKNAIPSPVNGMEVFDTDLQRTQVYRSYTWQTP